MAYHQKRGGMLLHDAVGVNCEKGSSINIMAHDPSIRAKGCIL